MRASFFLSSLLAFATGQAIAASIAHNHAAAHRRMQVVEEEGFEKRGAHSGHVHPADSAHLKALGFVDCGVNAEADNGGVWIGKDGPYTNTFINRSGKHVILVVWGTEGSWVNAKRPEITLSIPAGKKKTLSFSNTASGAWAVVGKNTKLVNGQISNTWGEYTFGPYGVVDVSREVNMNGHKMAIHGPKCVTDMERCVFVCPNGMETCWQQYELHNCDNGSQPGANYGQYAGMPSGGCGGMGDSAHLTTYIG
jgi:hypothetical protein